MADALESFLGRRVGGGNAAGAAPGVAAGAAFGAAASYAFYFLAGERIVAKRPPMAVVFWAALFASAFWLVFSGWWTIDPQLFGARVSLQHTPKRGRIVIEYAGNDDLQRILEKIGMQA